MFRRIALTTAAASLGLVMVVACNTESTEVTATTDTGAVGGVTTDTTATTGTAGALQDADLLFVADAAIGGLAEVQLGQLASEKATNAEVKQFGQMMVTDHGNANTELQTLAQSKSVQLPTTLNEEKTGLQQKLAALAGADFDREYMTEMVKDHKEDVEKFQKAANEAIDPEVKAFAAKTLPTLQQHLQKAEELAAKVGGTKS
jgi:putative membrane protein